MKSLPEEFWVQNFDAMQVEPALQLVYHETCNLLRDENPNADTLELMMIERVAFLYVYLRHKETKSAFAHDRVHKETFQLWAGMAAELRKHRNRVEDQVFLRQQIIAAVKLAVHRSVEVLPEDQRMQFQARLLDELEM